MSTVMPSPSSSSPATNGAAAAASTGSSNGKSVNGPPLLQQDFDSFYRKVCSDLQDRGEVHSMSKLFATLSCDEERMKFVLERNFGGSGGLSSWGAWRDFNFAHKDRAESQRLRNQGNQVRQLKSPLRPGGQPFSLGLPEEQAVRGLGAVQSEHMPGASPSAAKLFPTTWRRRPRRTGGRWRRRGIHSRGAGPRIR